MSLWSKPSPLDGGIEKEKQILRFALGERIAHWCHAALFFALLFTGFFLFIPSFRLIASGDYVDPVVHFHMTAAVIFVFLPIIVALLINRSPLSADAAEALKWGSADTQWIRQSPGGYLRGAPMAVPVGKFNPGQKVHVYATFSLVVGLAATGAVMWLAHEELFPQWLTNLSFKLHDLLTFLYLPMLAGHIYLAVGHPMTRESIRGMVGGKVSAGYAATHHRAWYEKMVSGAIGADEPRRHVNDDEKRRD